MANITLIVTDGQLEDIIDGLLTVVSEAPRSRDISSQKCLAAELEKVLEYVRRSEQ
jgi:hypothetical protein